MRSPIFLMIYWWNILRREEEASVPRLKINLSRAVEQERKDEKEERRERCPGEGRQKFRRKQKSRFFREPNARIREDREGRWIARVGRS